ncbi:MAG: hypothetical protein ACTSRS_04775 [Candidatus Helarchaeota archaeon]
MQKESRVRPKRGIIGGLLAAISFLLIPSLIILRIESGPLLGYSFTITENFKLALFLFGIVFTVCMFFYGYFPFDSRQSHIMGFGGFLTATIFFYFFVSFGMTETAGIFIFTSESTTIRMVGPLTLLIINILFICICIYGFLRIFKLKPGKLELEQTLHEKKTPSPLSTLFSIVIPILAILFFFVWLQYWF